MSAKIHDDMLVSPAPVVKPRLAVAGARKARKGKREQVPVRFAEVDATLASCDRLVVQLRGKATDLPEVRTARDGFVAGWFAARRIDDLAATRSAATPPSNGPAPSDKPQ